MEADLLPNSPCPAPSQPTLSPTWDPAPDVYLLVPITLCCPLQDYEGLDLEMLAPYISMDDDFQLSSTDHPPWLAEKRGDTGAGTRPTSPPPRPRSRSFHGMSPRPPEPATLPRWGSDTSLSQARPVQPIGSAECDAGQVVEMVASVKIQAVQEGTNLNGQGASLGGRKR